MLRFVPSRGWVAALALLAALCTLTTPRAARADEALARQHFKKGIELYDKKRYAEALAAFEDAYKEKPSAGIKQNIALSLKGLGKPVEAATAFDEALAEDNGTLKPETRAAIEQELAELSKVVATVTFVLTTADQKPIDNAVVSVAPSSGKEFVLPPDALERPLRLAPGTYTLTAKASGFPDVRKPPLSLVPGPPTDLTFVFGAASPANGPPGTLKVRPSIEDATIRVDGREVGSGAWEGSLPAGTHTVEVSAPGWKTTSLEVTIPSGGVVEYPVTLQATSDAPPEYVAPQTKRKVVKKLYGVPMLGLAGTTYSLSDDLGESGGGVLRSFRGGTIGGRVGWYFWKYLSAEMLLSLGSLSAEYSIRPADPNSKTQINHWQLTPTLRFTIPRDTLFRFIAASGFGLHGITVDGQIRTRGGESSRKASGVGWSWLIDAGAQLDLGPVFLEAAIVLDIHSLQAVRGDAPPEDRFLLSSPATRGSLRLGLGIPF